MLNKIKRLIRKVLLPNSVLLINKDKKAKKLYLTFDDGPHPEVTIPLLDLLRAHDVKATFFIIGQYAIKHPELIQNMIREGHKIANHTYTHPSFEKASLQKKLSEVIKTNNIIQEITGEKCEMFRAPKGHWDFKLLFKLFRLKITAIHWSRDSMDYLVEPPEKIINRFYKQPVESGDILLFHDDKDICIDALKTLIPLWKSEGYELAALEL
jgi:peptidoglycan/xylan/chitin deacetylase (PgdA/CDA1 family)